MLELNFPLLSDWNGEATRAFGVASEYRGMRDIARRTAFLVGAGGIIRGAWEYGVSEVPDFDALLAAVRSLS